MHKYNVIGHRGDGTFSAVLKAECKSTGRLVAIKCMKNRFESVEQVNRLREIQALRRLSPHPNITKLYEVLYDRSTGRLALVFEHMSMDLYELIKTRTSHFPEEKVLPLMHQVCRAVHHMHKSGIFHRDLKPENILVTGDRLKLTDFGSCRGIYSKQPFTEYIATRWYRPPECLVTDGYYNCKMDMWGVGCVYFEVVSLYPLFPGTNELDQLHKVHKVLGTPPAEVLRRMCTNGTHESTDFPEEDGVALQSLIPHVSGVVVDLIDSLLAYDPEDRITAKKALSHAAFKPLKAKSKKAGEDSSGSSAMVAAAHPCVMQSSPGQSAQAKEVPVQHSLPPILGASSRHPTTIPSLGSETPATLSSIPCVAQSVAASSTMHSRGDSASEHASLPSILTLGKRNKKQNSGNPTRHSSIDCLTELASKQRW